ncbi:SMP-30/gluconolactonase/LRE family protein [Winogradskyella endarachnes]|uniref:SMP-30/gluconolactonase/LRE family protein n=1 Tax=Winogradskyella endarachnes TaxID=2681965 RepID=A0A6L6U7R3_9FLAO|nr:SMP-30/gluconolactonase/LRE family protein [Winogradskyella endarachnes]MUU76937.1 SMP-30/gluconolactonase/LRE family protein [Winogradskyella endarachnes]
MTHSLVYQSNSELLEGPIFDEENRLLYFVSILDGLVFCYNAETKEFLTIKLDSPVGCVYILGYKKVMAASKNGFYKVDFETLRSTFSFQLEIDNAVRYNDGIADPKGRFLIGTMGYPQVINHIGKVLSYHNGTQKTLIENTTISNGLAFSLDNKFLYFIDTPTKKVAKYHYNINTGEVKFHSYVIEFTDIGQPDGMCIDKKGLLWIAEWEGACISQWNPENGQKIKDIQLPFNNITSCCLDNRSNLYVTTAQNNSKTEPKGGSLFYIELNKN